ncbi:MAG: alpha/beta hydrolase domain-containing protein [Pseudomonadota bacterium]
MTTSLWRVLGLCALLSACSDGSDTRISEDPDTLLPGEAAVTAPPEVGSAFLNSTLFALSSFGYEEQEYFIEGDATAFRDVAPLGEDGRWQVEPLETAPYRTRVLIYRPEDAADFSGSVYVEWLNVTVGFDLPVTYAGGHLELLRRGHAIAFVTVQRIGIEGSERSLAPLHLDAINPARYGPLEHPGDSFSYDIFTQVGAALERGEMLGSLEPRRLIAIGQSQSASRLITYYNAIQPLYQVYDGFLIQSSNNGSALSQDPQALVEAPRGARLRDDLAAPALLLRAEGDTTRDGMYIPLQEDSASIRIWEPAATAHNDDYSFNTGRFDDGNDAEALLMREQRTIAGLLTCERPINTGFMVWVLNAAINKLDRWVRSGEAPPNGPRFETEPSTGDLARDAQGIVLGGIRTPYADAPAAELSGVGNNTDSLCFLFGTTRLFDQAELENLYGSRAAYRAAVSDAVDSAVEAGFLLGVDGVRIKQAAGEQWDRAPISEPFGRISMPAVTPAPDGDISVLDSNFSPESVGFQRTEFFLEGEATAYSNVNALGEDGQWDVEPSTMAPYRSRIVVYAPSTASDFSGTVVVEWQNVSAGFETAPVWYAAHTEALRQGHVWIFVSAQLEGIEGAQNAALPLPLYLKAANPERYGELSHPGDSYSYDIYSQVARVLRESSQTGVLGDLVPQTLIAVGQSQSANRMASYVNAFHPLFEPYDAYLILSRTGNSAPLSQGDTGFIPGPARLEIRTDISAPVISLQAETDLFLLGGVIHRQPDSEAFRLWEAAGTSHADLYTNVTGRSDTGEDPSFAVVQEVDTVEGVIQCDGPQNNGPGPWIVNAALRSLEVWARDGQPAASVPLLELDDAGEAFELDELGNVLGGLRTPYVDAPAARLSGEGQAGGSFCFTFGTTQLFDAATMAMLYVDQAGYEAAVAESADAAVERGVLLAEDAERIKAAASLQWQALSAD